MWPKFAFGNQKGLIRKKDMSFGNPPHNGTENCGLFKNVVVFTFYGSKSGVLGQKTVVWGVLDRV